ncbi:MAG: glycosyltransferase [Thermoanaerobaculia bacterium]
MKILHLCHTIGPSSGGQGAVAAALAGHQRKCGHEAHIWCHGPPEVAAEMTSAAGSNGAVMSYEVVGPFSVGFSPAAERAARLADYDVVHQHGIWTAQGRVATIFRLRGIPTVVAPHGSLEPVARARSAWKKRIALAWFESENLRATSCLHATGENEVRTFRDFGLRAPIAILPNGVDTRWLSSTGDDNRFRARHAITGDERIILFLSRIHPQKGLPLLIEAIAGCKEQLRGWRLLIAGPDELGHRAEVEALASRRGLSSMVKFVGPMFDQEKRDAFAAASLFVLPTHGENFAIVVAEALGAGLPVITTHGVPWREIEDNRCGWWVSVDANAIRNAIVDAVSRSPDELKLMGSRGRDVVATRYVWPTITDKSLAVYRWLKGETSRPDFVTLD